MVLRIAHRGASSYAPENTLEAFRKAVKLKLDIVEFDVHHTKDGKLVIIHDHNIKRTMDGLGLIHKLSLKELRKFHEPNGESVPTLQEVINILKGHCILKIDIKDDKGLENAIFFIRKSNEFEKNFEELNKKCEADGSKKISCDVEINRDLLSGIFGSGYTAGTYFIEVVVDDTDDLPNRKEGEIEIQEFLNPPEGDLWELPKVDSKTVVKLSPIVEEDTGMKIKTVWIRRGGYNSVEEAINDLMEQIEKAIREN